MKSFSRTILYVVMGILIVALLSAAGTVLVLNHRAENIITMTTEEYSRITDLLAFNELVDDIESQAYGGAPSREELLEGAARGMVDTLDDPYAKYYTAQEYEAYLSSINGEYYGVGLLVGQPDGVGALVLEVYEGNPAEKAGVQAGDIITAINSAPTANLSLEEIRSMMDAQTGEAVALTLLRGTETISLSVTGDTVNIKRVKGSLFNEHTGYIKIDMFTGDCASEFEETLKTLKSRNMRSLVIDLRNNPGGSLDDVVKICGLLLDKGKTIVSVGEEDGADNEVYTATGHGIGVPLAILVNQNSASASEIMAGAVQDNEAGVIVGTQSYGKGVVQTTMRVEKSGGWLKLTTAAYFTPGGRNIHGVGITPDILCELPEALQGKPLSEIDQSEDAQLWAALDYVREQAQQASE
ncbi:MAG: S41 family peptidase [Candidatus Pelethousia sp.]|nr:S41 family peptidase [Candidatus Pelethousia sp.]